MDRPADPAGAGGRERPVFYLSVVPGLEAIAAAEARARGADVTSTRPGKVFFRHQGDRRELLSLRGAMNVHAFIDEQAGCPPGAGGRAWLREHAARLDLGPALAAYASLWDTPGSPSFRVTATRSGQHDYTSPEIAAWVGAELEAMTGWNVSLEEYDYNVEVELVGDRALFGLRLCESWPERRRKPAYHPASLNPTVAFAMIQMCGAEPDDVFLDPACGGGTLLAERAAAGPAGIILGGDIWPHALDIARRNLEASRTAALLARWDARRLPLPADSVDRSASNLPFGHRIGRGPAVRAFYRRLVPELARVLRPGGRAALLTSRKRWLSLAIGDSPNCRQERRLRILLGGKEAFIFLLSCQG